MNLCSELQVHQLGMTEDKDMDASINHYHLQKATKDFGRPQSEKIIPLETGKY